MHVLKSKISASYLLSFRHPDGNLRLERVHFSHLNCDRILTPKEHYTSSPGRNRAGSPVLMRPSTVFFLSLTHRRYGCLRGSLHVFLLPKRWADKLEVPDPSRGCFRVHESRVAAESFSACPCKNSKCTSEFTKLCVR